MTRLIIIASLIVTIGFVLMNTLTYVYAVRTTLAPLDKVAGAINSTSAASTNR